MKMNATEMKADRKGERGVALLSTLLLAILLLSAGGALVLSTTMSATTAIDSTAEMQAYYGAEAGLQATINTLRGNVWNNSSTPAASFRTAVEPSQSNVAGDPATSQNIARLSKWLTYDSNNRIVVAGTENQIAYSVTARDLDDSKNVRFSTSAVFQTGSSGCTVVGQTLTCLNGANSFTLTYTPRSAATQLAYPSVNTNFGTFTMATVGAGATLGSENPVTFLLTIDQTLPWPAKDTLVGTISGNASVVNSTLQLSFTGSTAKTDGTTYTLCGTCNPLTLNVGTNTLSGTLTAPQPKRILVRSAGFGPKGAVKRLEMVLNNSAFDFDAPAVLTLRGSDNGTAMTFDAGSSGAKTYSGIDNSGSISRLPTFAVSGSDISTTNNGISKHDTVDDPEIAYLDIGSPSPGNTVSTFPVQTPVFLQTANNARSALATLKATAISMNRYFTPSVAGGSYTVAASNTTPDGITFVDGNCILDGGSGLLVVTGDLNMSGNPSFNGVVLVLGGGSVNRNGGGDGNFYGAMVVASFDPNGTGGFTAPFFKTNGSGNSTVQYDYVAVSRAMSAVGVSVGGVREY